MQPLASKEWSGSLEIILSSTSHGESYRCDSLSNKGYRIYLKEIFSDSFKPYYITA